MFIYSLTNAFQLQEPGTVLSQDIINTSFGMSSLVTYRGSHVLPCMKVLHPCVMGNLEISIRLYAMKYGKTRMDKGQ